MPSRRGLLDSAQKTADPFLKQGFAFTQVPTKNKVGPGCCAAREHLSHAQTGRFS